MKLAELQARQGNVDVEVTIVNKGDVRSFSKFGKEGTVCNAQIKDDSGEMKLTLWNEQVEQVNVGDKVKITNGYVGEWQGEKQLSTGKFGKLEVTGKGAAPEAAPADAVEAKPAVPEAPVDDEVPPQEIKVEEESV